MKVFWVAVAVVVGACAHQPVAPQKSAGEVAVVARFEGRDITAAEVDAAAQSELLELGQKIYEARKSAAERIALEALVEGNAKKAGQTAEVWIRSQIEAGIAEAGVEEGSTAHRRLTTQVVRALFEKLKTDAGYQVLLPRPERPRKAVEASGPTKGPADAKVTIVVFSDFECPYCARAVKTMDRVFAAYPGQLKLVYRHYPLSFHKQAVKAAEGAICADEQGRFWEFHDGLYERQSELGVEDLKGQALRLGLDVRKFAECLDSGRTAAQVERDKAAGSRLGIDGTPAYFVNGVLMPGARDEAEYRELIDEELARAK